MFKKWRRKLQWNASCKWYRFKLWWGWWYCEKCEKMHSPFTDRYDFNEDEQFECGRGVYDIPVNKAYEGDPEYFYGLAKNLHRVG